MKATKRSTSKKVTRRVRPKKEGALVISNGPSRTMLGGTNPSRSMVFKGVGFPDRLTTNLVYTDSFILTPSAGNIIPSKCYRMNGPFDPDFALGGGQPTYYDQLAIIYRRYVVNGAKLTAMFSRSSTTAANIGPYVVGITCSTNQTTPIGGGASAQMQLPNTTYDVLAQDDGTRVVVSTFSKKANLPSLMDAGQSLNNALPAQLWNAVLWASPQGVDVVAPVNVILKLEMNVTWSETQQVVDA